MKQVIITNGSGGCGKDTFATFMANHVTTTKYSSIDFFKLLAKLGGMGEKKGEKERKLLSTIKQAFIDYNDLPFYHTSKVIEDFLKEDNDIADVLLIDIREPEEIHKIVQKYPNVITVLITNNNVPIITSNSSDFSVFDYKYDYVIENNGNLDDLEESVKTFLKAIGS